MSQKKTGNILQGSVTTRLGCGGIFSDEFITDLLPSVAVKEFEKSFGI